MHGVHIRADHRQRGQKSITNSSQPRVALPHTINEIQLVKSVWRGEY